MLVFLPPVSPGLTSKQENISIVNAEFGTDRFGICVNYNFLDASPVQVPDPALPAVLVRHGRPGEAGQAREEDQEGQQ